MDRQGDRQGDRHALTETLKWVVPASVYTQMDMQRDKTHTDRRSKHTVHTDGQRDTQQYTRTYTQKTKTQTQRCRHTDRDTYTDTPRHIDTGGIVLAPLYTQAHPHTD